ncbi:MAG: type II toxin-antitoxin system YafQ family toxin [Erysipelotrichaceae bacterium]|nr:type II toxin-antitoxin system YafQ family toxin [Erysipelotrichaceae bacterium]
MRYKVQFTSTFKRDISKAEKQNKDLNKIFNVIEKLANGEKLSRRFRDHQLSGEYKKARECHIEPDWLLVYKINNNLLVLELLRTGTHSELFK